MTASRSLVVFDLDGVLIDSAEANVQAFNFGLNQAGIPPAKAETILGLVGLPALDMLRLLGCPKDSCLQVFEEHVRPFYLQHLPELARAYPGAEELLKSLKEEGFRVAACTSGDRTTQTQALQSIGLWDLIEAMQTPDDSLFGKPDPRYLQELLAQFEEPTAVHHVEDSEVGLKMGRAVGATIYFAAYGNGTLSGDVAPDYVLERITDLGPLLFQSRAY